MMQSMCRKDHELVIYRLPIYMKVLIVVLVIIPRVGISSYLLWLGCRWLIATNNFSDMVMNAVALEFILLLKELLYKALISVRNRLDLERTKLQPRYRKRAPTCGAFTRTVVYGLLSCVWVLACMGVPEHFNGIQQVLPDYKWDVRMVCKRWIEWRYCVNPPCPVDYDPLG